MVFGSEEGIIERVQARELQENAGDRRRVLVGRAGRRAELQTRPHRNRVDFDPRWANELVGKCTFKMDI